MVLETNAALLDDPTLINRDPEGEGWCLRLHLTDRDAFDRYMNRSEYTAFIQF